MSQKNKHMKGRDEDYTIVRHFRGERTAEEVVAALVKAHR